MSLSTEDVLLGPERQCPGCGEYFRSFDMNRKYCDCNRNRDNARTAKRAAHDVEFIGIDGEGIGRGRDHRYVLMGCGTSQATNTEGFGWEGALQFLYECYRESPGASYVGFFLGYDWTQILKSLPENRARMLLSPQGIAKRQRKGSGGNPIPFPVYLKGQQDWDIDALGLKRIKFRPKGEKSWMYVCDCGPFFQMSFLKAIDPKSWEHPIVSQAEYDLIKEGKERRDSAELDSDMRKYMALEIDTLSRAMGVLNKGFTKAGVRLNRGQWYGPGQAAQSWMKNNGVPTSKQVFAKTPKYALNAAKASYYGGWFELFIHGYIRGTTWENDVNSAYPAVIANLPCLLHGTWQRSRFATREQYPDLCNVGQYALCHATLRGSDSAIGCAMHRCSDGTIMRPHSTSGWYWRDELAASQRAGLIDTIEIDQVVEYHACTCAPPIRGIRGLYEGRLSVGKNSPEGKGYKLLYNSEYGKFAQSVGSPVFANPIYASLITSGCRTAILDAISTHPGGTNSVAMVATDGVYFLDRHPGLPLSNKLGEWEETPHENMTLFKPGVYWDDKARMALAKDEAPQFKARGVNAKALSRCLLEIDQQFSGWQTVPAILPDEPGHPNWPAVEFPVEFSMVSLVQAMAWGRWFQAGLIQHNKKVKQDSNPVGKRTSPYLDNDLIRTHPWPRGNFGELSQESTPYKRSFGMPTEYDDITPDGGIIDVLAQAITGEAPTDDSDT